MHQEIQKLLGSQITALVDISQEQKSKRLEKAADTISVRKDGDVHLPRPVLYKNHNEYALDAFTKFDQPTQKAFMRAFNAIVRLDNEIADNKTDMPELNPALVNLRNKIVNAALLLLSEKEVEMINEGSLPKHATAHATSLILYEDNLIPRFNEKYSSQLRVLRNESPESAQSV